MEDKKPEILIVTELQLDLNSDFNMTSMPGYNFEIDNLYEKMASEELVCGLIITLFMKESVNWN